MKKLKIKKRRLWLIIVSVVVAVAGVVVLGSVIWYKQMLRPVSAEARQKISRRREFRWLRSLPA